MLRVDFGRRLLFLAVVFALVGGALVVRLGYWQISQRDRLVEAARRQISVRTELPSQRGDIYDRSGTIALASTVIRERLVASGQQLTPDQRATLVALLRPILSLTDDQAAAMQAKLDTGRPYVVLAQDLSPTVAEAIRSAAQLAGLPSVAFETTSSRSYQPGAAPGTSLAAQLIGFVNGSGAGQYGVEQRYQDVLAGTPQVVEADKDTNGQPMVDTERTVTAGAPGADLRLTIDAGLQLAIEQEVLAAQIADNADSVSAVVMDPWTGEIYAEASYPSYDANAYGTTADQNASRFLDPVVSEVYEPGSVMKLLTVIAALETGTATLKTVYRDTGRLVLNGGRNVVWDVDHIAMGRLPLEDAIAYSRNVVASKVAFGLGPSLRDSSMILHSVWTRFGLGRPTGIDVAGEVRGLVSDPAISTWRQIDLANASFGQGVAVTPIQLAVAYAAMVNGGILVRPHVVAAIGGAPVTVEAQGQVMDSALTPQLQGLMQHVLESRWYRNDVKGTGFWLGGKTGTAQIWDPKLGRWLVNKLNFSFVGFAGRRPGHPDLIVAIKIGGARPAITGIGQVVLGIKSTELFRRVATDAMTTPGLVPPPAEGVPSDGRGE